MKEYQLRDMTTGLFDTGKLERDETANGKIRHIRIVWGKRGKRFKMLNHLTMRLNNSLTEPVQSTWEIIEYELIESARFSATSVTRKR